jgi:triosephosphate isomerase
MTRNYLIVANWKMNGSLAGNEALVQAVRLGLVALPARADVALCSPSVYLPQLQQLLVGGNVSWGAQDVSDQLQGAYTGEVSADMLREWGCQYVIVGHSERRQRHCETDDIVAAKAQRALAEGVTPIVCVGETLQEREAGLTEAVVKRQLAAVIHTVGHCSSEIVVAYEPVWAIGTGLTAEPEQAQAVHAVLRQQLQAATGHGERNRLLYGGSMNAVNAPALLAQPDIDGGLIGGASLRAEEFLSIVASCPSQG